MSEQVRRSWFRFSLRTLLVVMTALCVWLAWESSIVRGRRAARNEVRDNPAFQLTTADDWVGRNPPDVVGPYAAEIPLLRRWLGDQAIQEIGYFPQFPSFSQAQLDRLVAAFPEAKAREREILHEPCHPGCFPRGTLVGTSHGQRAIESIAVGDWVTTFSSAGEASAARVQSIFVTENRLWQVTTEDGVLLTTETQPLCLAAGPFRQAGELLPGEQILRYADGVVEPTAVVEIARTDRIEQVINLVLGDSEAFVAGGFVARSKPPPEVASR